MLNVMVLVRQQRKKSVEIMVVQMVHAILAKQTVLLVQLQELQQLNAVQQHVLMIVFVEFQNVTVIVIVLMVIGQVLPIVLVTMYIKITMLETAGMQEIVMPIVPLMLNLEKKRNVEL